MFERALQQAIERTRLIVPGSRIGVAVSGGADSVALLRLLNTARAKLGVTLAVLHFDHKLRDESGSDAAFVAGLAASLGLEFSCGDAVVSRIALEEKRNVEDAGRRLRYAFFANAVKTGLCTQVAVAHTMDDQAETVLARLLRGSGPSGLAGIYPSAGTIIRPLLGVRRAALREYLRSVKQPWREDATNEDTTRQRARIRATLLPLLERDFSPSAVEHLAHLAQLSHEETRFWSVIVEDRFEALAAWNGESVSIPIAKLVSPLGLKLREPAPSSDAMRTLTERLVRRLYRSVRRSEGSELGLVHIEQVIALTQGAPGKHVELPGGVRASRDFGALTFTSFRANGLRKPRRETRFRECAYQYTVELGLSPATDVSVPELGTCFRLKVIDWPAAERETKMWRSVLDLSSLRPPLILRSWLPGDNYRPKGRRKPRKLKEMLLAARVTPSARAGWPVLESAGQVIWAKGMDPAGEFCAKADTRLGVLIEERKL